MEFDNLKIEYNKKKRLYYVGVNMSKKQATNFVNNLCYTRYG